MKTTFDEEEDLAGPMHDRRYDDDPHDREITLNSGTLLAIFFGLVLLCGLFFGMGYTLGRRSPVPSTSDMVDKGTATSLVADSRPKPSASSQAAVPQPVEEETPKPDPQPEAGSTGEATADTPKPQVQEAVMQTQTVKPALTAQVETAAPANGIMVQIAAISNPADADVLVSALRKHGYTVTVRHEPSDALLHVQVGPFATRAEANAMRQTLLGDGYNAILK
jgi:cell division septation protein DedD